MLQRGIAWQRRAPQDADLSPLVSILLAACSRPPCTHCSEGLQCTDSVCHTRTAQQALLSKLMNKDPFTFLILCFLVMHFPRNITYLLVQPNEYQISAWLLSTFPMPTIQANPDWARTMWQKAFWILDWPSRSLREMEIGLDFFPKAQIP